MWNATVIYLNIYCRDCCWAWRGGGGGVVVVSSVDFTPQVPGGNTDYFGGYTALIGAGAHRIFVELFGGSTLYSSQKLARNVSGFRRNQTMVMTLNINLLQEGEKQQRSTAQPVS